MIHTAAEPVLEYRGYRKLFRHTGKRTLPHVSADGKNPTFVFIEPKLIGLVVTHQTYNKFQESLSNHGTKSG